MALHDFALASHAQGSKLLQSFSSIPDLMTMLILSMTVSTHVMLVLGPMYLVFSDEVCQVGNARGQLLLAVVPLGEVQVRIIAPEVCRQARSAMHLTSI